jgi:NAD(P)-dependent dehydrogenase (short-subunit alcohol dehydrogenase family)
VDSFAGKLAVVTGGGSGMGRELARQLAVEGCSVATCDVNTDSVAQTAAVAQQEAPPGVLVTSHGCDVGDEKQVIRFRDEVLGQHGRDHVNLVFSNAGIGGGGSFVNDSRAEWERTFATDWYGVYHCARAFLPLLIASKEGVLVNTSSVNGFWATLGPGMPQTAYSTAKFAIRGFSEALIEDLRTNAPHVRVALVMPGHVGTDIVVNSRRAHGQPGPEQMSTAELDQARGFLAELGIDVAGQTDGELRQTLARLGDEFKNKAPVSAAQAATVILDGVRSGTWRILVGDDARWLDERVRADPENAYDYDKLFQAAKASGLVPEGVQTPADAVRQATATTAEAPGG